MTAGEDKPQSNNGRDSSLVSHLTELRSRFIKAFIAVAGVFVVLFPFANELYEYLSEPLLRYLPEGTSMIAIEVASPFLVPFKLSLLLAVVVAMPYVLYQLWAFVVPGLYRHEQRLMLPLLVSGTLLFYAGILFAYYAVFPLVFGFFTGVAPENVAVMTDIGRYLDFVFKLFIAFGAAFEVPVVTLLMVKMEFMTREELAAKRPYVIVGAFIVGMVLTPPDVISQVLLAVPVWLLFELGLMFSRFATPARSPAAADDGGTGQVRQESLEKRINEPGNKTT